MATLCPTFKTSWFTHWVALDGCLVPGYPYPRRVGGRGITVLYLEWILKDRSGPVDVLQPMLRGADRQKVHTNLREEVARERDSCGLRERCGPERVLELLKGVSGGRPVVLNATSHADFEVFVLGLLAAEEEGKRFLYRTGPSFVRTRGGITEPKILRPEDLYRKRSKEGHGLVLVGSYVPTTTRQLEGVLALDGVRGVEMSVPRLLEPGSREDELGRVAEDVNGSLASSEVVVYTSRELITAGKAGSAGLSNFDIGTAVSGALVDVMRRVDRTLPLSFVVAKGGITSSDIATKGLEVRRAEVAGPLLPPGIVPVWILPKENDFPGLPYVIVPCNVGGPDSLARAVELLRGER